VSKAVRVVVLLCVLVGGWLFLDLYLRVDLPFAAALIHLVFRGAATCVTWLEAGDGGRPMVVAWVVVGIGAVALIPGRWTAPVRSGGALPLVAGQVALVAISGLMERGLFVGIVVGGLLGARAIAAREVEVEAGTKPGPRLRAARVGLALVTGGASLYYLAELLAARSDGYLLDDLPAWLTTSGRLGTTWLLLCLVLGAGAAARTRRDSVYALAGVVTAILVGLLLDPGLTLLSAVVVGAAGSLLLAAGWAPFVTGPAAGRWDPATWPARLAPAAAIAGLLIGHTYAVRVFGCSAALEHPALTRVAAPGEVFRIAVGGDGSVAALSLRAERRFGRLDLLPEPGELGFAEPGPIPTRRDRVQPPGTTLASTEELLWAPAAHSFFGTVLGGDPDFYSLPESPPNVVNNLIVRLSADGGQVEEAVGIEHLCWIGAMAWQDDDRRLYLGCEYEPVLHRYDPTSGAVEHTLEDELLGDVAAIAVDPREGSDRLFTVSFWSSQAVAEVSRSTLEVQNRVNVGGAHYDLAYDPGSDRLFLSSYYGSRVRILDGSDLRRAGRVATGLGARALAVDSSRDLLLASSVYDAAITACRSSTGERLARLEVGGHVKDIAIDEQRGLAWFASRCGLFRLDLSMIDDRGDPR
jgi:hypothetical protein